MTEPLMRRDEMHFNINVLTTYLGFFFFSEVYTLNYFSIFTSYFPVLSITVYCFRVIDYLQTLSIALCWLVEVKEEALLLTF